MLQHLTIRRKLTILTVCYATGLIAFAWHAQSTLSHVKVNGPLYQKIIQGKDLLADILPPPEYLVESYLLAFQLIQATDRANISLLVEQSHTLAREFEARHAYWAAHLSDGTEKRLLIEQAYTPGRKFLNVFEEEFLSAIEAGDRARANAIAVSTLKQHYDAHRIAINELVGLANARHAGREKEAATILDRSVLAMKLVAVITLLILTFFSLFVARSILVPVRKLHAAVSELAGGNGDLTKRLPATGRDELSTLCEEFNRFLDTLRSTITAVSETTGTVAETTRQLFASLAQLTQEAQGQARQATHAASAIEEMSATSADMATQTHEVGATSAETTVSSDRGHAMVSDAMSGITKLAEMVEGSASQIRSLGQRSDQIGEIVKVIHDIADQTNLLALNAAIEAARAGEQGRGFAVVADEVRKLAESTTKATNEIGNTIRIIQAQTTEAVVTMQAGSQAAQDTKSTAMQAGHHLGTVIGKVHGLSALVQQIAASVQEQSKTNHQLAINVQDVAASTHRMQGELEQARLAAHALATRAHDLNRVVGTFRLA